MPEGHTIHRQVVDQAPALVGHKLAVSSPNRRFAAGAALLDGRVLESMDAWGKHLFYFFDGRKVLHVHLGMEGRFRHHRLQPQTAPPPGRSVWLRAVAAELTLDLTTPRVCELIDPIHQRHIVAALGPDPIRPDANGDSVRLALRAFEGPIGVALLDQSLVAGIGNMYRAEILFAMGIHPERPAATVTADEWSRMWQTATRMLRAGVSARPPTYVYGQRMCARCRSPIRKWPLAGRTVWACETCQPRWEPAVNR